MAITLRHNSFVSSFHILINIDFFFFQLIVDTAHSKNIGF